MIATGESFDVQRSMLDIRCFPKQKHAVPETGAPN